MFFLINLVSRVLNFLQMNVSLYGLLGVVTALLIYLVGIGTIVKLFICLLALILGYGRVHRDI